MAVKGVSVLGPPGSLMLSECITLRDITPATVIIPLGNIVPSS